MNKISSFLLAIFFVTLSVAASGKGSTGFGRSSFSSGYSYKAPAGTGSKMEHESVSGYTKSNGTRVNEYDRSTKDQTMQNNWSTKGNINPETGKAGTK